MFPLSHRSHRRTGTHPEGPAGRSLFGQCNPSTVHLQRSVAKHAVNAPTIRAIVAAQHAVLLHSWFSAAPDMHVQSNDQEETRDCGAKVHYSRCHIPVSRGSDSGTGFAWKTSAPEDPYGRVRGFSPISRVRRVLIGNVSSTTASYQCHSRV